MSSTSRIRRSSRRYRGTSSPSLRTAPSRAAEEPTIQSSVSSRRLPDKRRPEDWTAAFVKTTQGYYAVRPDGKLLRANPYMELQREPGRIRTLLAQALAAFRASSSAKVARDVEGVAYHPSLPPGTLVAHVYSRITNGKRDYPWPEDWEGDEDVLNAVPARDVIWIASAEVQALLGGTVTPSLRRRLLLGHLRDFVRGQPRLFKMTHVKLGSFTARATRSATAVRVHIAGRFQIDAPPFRSDLTEGIIAKMGIQGKLDGELTYDLDTQRVTGFLMHASCVAGGEYFLTPCAPPGRYALQIGFELADQQDPIARSVPPHATGDDELAGSYLETGRSYR